jgi:hypothetical protein
MAPSNLQLIGIETHKSTRVHGLEPRTLDRIIRQHQSRRQVMATFLVVFLGDIGRVYDLVRTAPDATFVRCLNIVQFALLRFIAPSSEAPAPPPHKDHVVVPPALTGASPVESDILPTGGVPRGRLPPRSARPAQEDQSQVVVR